MNIVTQKVCNECNKLKDSSEFSKCRNRKDGLQPKCKECNKKDNKEYRTHKPEYWSYENGYFSDKEKWEYISLYQAADKTIKIYTIKFPDGSMYVGSTKAHLNVRLSRHLADYKRAVRHKKKAFPLLHPKFDEFKTTEELVEHLKNNTFIIDECSGSKTKQLRLEAIWILRLQKQGYKLLNKLIPHRFKNIKV